MRALLEHARHDPDRIERTKALEPDKAAINAAAELIIKSLLIGIDNAVSGNRFADEAEDIAELPFYEAVEYLRKKDVLPAKKYYELSDKARFRAFTLSRIADGDVMQRIKDMLAQNVSEGGGLGEFLKKTDEEIMQGCGLGGSGGGWYWENVYRTNVQTAYNAGRAIGYEAAPPIALELVGINDARQTAVCRRLTQPPVRRLYTDEFWRTHWPPFHFGCRTTVRAIYDARELEEHPVTGVPDGEEPAKGFGRYPVTGGSWWKELKSMAARAQKYGVQQEIERAKKKLFSEKSEDVLDKQKPVDKAVLNRVLKALKKQGVTVWMDNEADKFLNYKGAEASTLYPDIIAYHSKLSVSGMFEEIIHLTQLKKLGHEPSKTETIKMEIEAKEKLLRNSKAYGITDYETQITRESIAFYQKLLNEQEADNV